MCDSCITDEGAHTDHKPIQQINKAMEDLEADIRLKLVKVECLVKKRKADVSNGKVQCQQRKEEWERQVKDTAANLKKKILDELEIWEAKWLNSVAETCHGTIIEIENSISEDNATAADLKEALENASKTCCKYETGRIPKLLLPTIYHFQLLYQKFNLSQF